MVAEIGMSSYTVQRVQREILKTYEVKTFKLSEGVNAETPEGEPSWSTLCL